MPRAASARFRLDDREDRRTRRGALCATALVGITCLSACAERVDTRANPGAGTTTLAIGVADPRPRAARLSTTFLVNTLSSERLLHYERDGRLEPALAEHWESSPDGLTWRFKLRRGHTLQDGSPLTASIARGALERMRSTPAPGGRSPGLHDITSIEEEGSHTLIIRLSRPNMLLLEEAGLWTIEGPGGSAQRAGPFRIEAREASSATLSAFSDYYRGRPRLDRIEIREYPNARNAWGAMMRGEIDFLYDVAPEAQEFIERSSTTQVSTFLRPYVTAMVFNLRHPILRRREVRVALNAAVDRTEIMKVAVRGRGYPATDHVWPKHWAYDALLPRLNFDPARAAAMLDGAGLTTVRAGQEGGQRFAFTCLVVADDPRFERAGLILQRQLVEMGIDVRLEPVTAADLMQRLTNGDYDAFLFELVAGYGFKYPYWFWNPEPDARFFDSGYQSAKGPLEQIRRARSDAEVRPAVHALQRVMRDDPPAIFLYWGEVARAISRRFIVPPVADRDILSTIAQWQVAARMPE